MTINFPNWFWWFAAIMLLIVICVLLKFNLSIGYEGIHATQGLVK